MELFKVLNPKFFSIFHSKNREIYVTALFALRELFLQEAIIEKEVLISKLVNKMEKDVLLRFDNIEEEEEQARPKGKDARSTAHYLIRKLEECGWIEQDYNLLADFKENIVLPPYSVRIINVLKDITEESEIVFTSHIYSIYSNLYNADVNAPEYRYLALHNADQGFSELTNSLKILAHDLRRRQRLVSILNTSKEILSEHFDDYTKNILEQIYLPLKTQDSIQRFKGIILEILYRWLRSPSTLEQIGMLAKDKLKLASLNEAENIVVDLVSNIGEHLETVESLVNDIDARHNAYISAVTEKLRSLIYTNKSTKKKLTSLLAIFSSGNQRYLDRVIETTSVGINLQKQGYLDTESMFIRAGSEPKVITPPQPIDFYDGADSSGVYDFVESSLKSPYASTMVLEYLKELMENRNSIDFEDWELKDVGELIKAITATIRGFDTNTFYTTSIDEHERINSGGFNVPLTTFTRRRKL